jgi:hypothetical protein
MKTTLRSIQKMLRLLSANVVEGASVVRLKMESTHAYKVKHQNGPATVFLETAGARFVAAAGTSADVERLTRVRE